MGKTGVVKILLGTGSANPNASTAEGITPLTLASENGNAQAIEALVEGGANVNHIKSANWTSFLMIASNKGKDAAVSTLIRLGANVQLSHPTGRTSLHFAIENGHLGVVQIRLKANINPNQAHQSSSTHVIDALIQAGANVNHVKPDGMTPLIIAAQMG